MKPFGVSLSETFHYNLQRKIFILAEGIHILHILIILFMIKIKT